ncbi:hypothetical protein ACL6C3_03385 [Capilliphycus salinus ALCB114379]|uniref:hypothetical protein n=1 Tax=Capilliphycus salinus TaxID=2768948 RepID=UPI0039A61945
MVVALFSPDTLNSASVIKFMDERLEQLIRQVQDCGSTVDRSHLLDLLVDEILRSRSWCRPSRGQPLSGIYLEIYQAVHKQLASEVDRQINSYNPEKLPVREWINGLRSRALRLILTHDRLQIIALEAQKNQPDSESRQYALRELVEAIRCSGKLCHPHRGKFSPDFYKLLYEEAVNQTLVYVCQKIDTYDPFRGGKFMTWVNFRLDKLVIECYRQFSSPQTQSFACVDDLERVLEKQQPLTPTRGLSIELREILEEDPNNFFKKEHIRARPDANFRAIALAVLSGKSWKEISVQFDLPIGTLSSFFGRTCRKLAPTFKEYLSAETA